MKKNIKRFLLCCFFILQCSLIGTAASEKQEVSTVNRISTGDVHIDLQEYELQNNKEVPFRNHQIVLPGDHISKIPRIKNLGEDCYVRTSVTFFGDVILNDSDLEDVQKGWKKIGAYYYYTNILKKSSSVDLFRGLFIPAELTEAESGNVISVDLRAEAIQAEAFTPDFNSENPWGDMPIEDCVHETDNSLLPDSRPVLFRVEYEGDSGKLVLQEEDFFRNFERLMPGVSYSDKASIQNSSKNSVELFFHTGYDSADQKQQELLEALHLTIRYNRNKIYDGTLKAEELIKGISLGVFAPGETGEMAYTITVPKTLTNTYAKRSAEVVWTYSVKVPNSSITPDPGTGEFGGGGGSSGSNPVKTGDETPLVCWAVLLILGMTSTGWILFRKRRDRHEI
ncbi:MAG: hypothetical protein Q4B26_08500 [Eubacteriales bacterium]|nr:hypothetical protein [Eubacteriales bacterium]